MQNEGLKPRVPKYFSFIDITLKLTKQVSKNCRQKKIKGSKTLIIHRNQDLVHTSKACFDTFSPVNVVNSDVNHSQLPIFQQ